MSRKQGPHVVGMRPPANAASHRHDASGLARCVEEVAR
jgi:hypothetical protein